ncbi:hypothetical protein SAMN05414139_09445 [Burkholderia sp. D7]|nr:hypothetical protein SAMN05414139_09445 [Burkholderia sp. D7]
MQEKGQSRGIFLHTGWRSAGTWVWSRFRVLQTVTAFYEPLHPILGDLRAADIPALEPTWTSGHPTLTAPYFTEYRPFIQDNLYGVTGYRKSFSTDRFGPVPDAGFPALQAYLKNLCDQTRNRGKTPVFKFCRSLGRLTWFKSAFPEVMHAVVLRNPASQFASGWLLHQQWSNPFFVAAPFRVLGLNQAEPIVKQVIDVCGVRLLPTPVTAIDEYAAACEQYVRTVEGDNAYRAFLALWILCALRSAGDADLLIDLDRLGQSSEYASELRAQVRAQVGITPGFNGARDLVAETRRNAARMKGIDGRLIRPINASALNFIASQKGSMRSKTGFIEIIKEKLALASELSEQWRY